MHRALAIVLVGCVAAVSAVTLHKGPIDSIAENQRDMYVGMGPIARGRGMYNTKQNNDMKVHHVGIQQDDDGIDTRFNGQQPKGGSLQYTFKPDFEALVNPKNNNSDWRWAMTSYNMEAVADNGTILRDESENSIKLISLPFRSWVPQDNTRVPPIADIYEALLVNKQNITVLPGQKLAVNVRFSCKTYNNEDHPLAANRQSVTKPEDDPSLAACGFGIMSYDDSALGFSIVATNKGIWVLYQRNRFELFSHPERNQKEFTIFKKIAKRSSPYETIDATIVYDHVENNVKFLLDGEVVYTLGELGTIKQSVEEQKAYKDVYNVQREDLQQRVEPQDFQVVVGLTQFPDTIDPNNPSNPPVRTTKLTSDPTYYDDDAKFENKENNKMYVLFGEGAEMDLVSTNIKLVGASSGSGRANPSNVQNRRHNGRRGKSYQPEDDQEQVNESSGDDNQEQPTN